MKFLSPSWECIFDQSVDLANKIRSDGEPTYDGIVGVSRGGLVLTRLLSDLLEIQDVMIAKCEYYSDLGERKKQPVITQKIQGSIKDKRVLLVDDVADTGESLNVILTYLVSKKPHVVRTATLYIKPSSVFRPDYFVTNTDRWIIFPWETYEAVKSLVKKNGIGILDKTGIPNSVIRKLRWMNGSPFSDGKSEKQTARKGPSG